MKYLCVCKCEISVEAEGLDSAEDIAIECIEEESDKCYIEDCICDCEEA